MALITSVCLLLIKKTVSFYHQTQLTVRSDLTDEQIQNYVETERPLNCAGSYMIENLGISLFESVETTDFTSIIGLPLIQLTKHLNSLAFRFHEVYIFELIKFYKLLSPQCWGNDVDFIRRALVMQKKHLKKAYSHCLL